MVRQLSMVTSSTPDPPYSASDSDLQHALDALASSSYKDTVVAFSHIVWTHCRTTSSVRKNEPVITLAGLDINKKGTEAGEKKVPESLGLAPGLVFLVRPRHALAETFGH